MNVVFGTSVVLTSMRVRIAYALAIATDISQWLLGPLGWTFADEILDVIATALISATIGFHPLLLPTFILEFVPVADMLPTWTACVALVVTLRRRHEPQPPGPGQVIDV